MSPTAERSRMVDRHLALRGIADPRVLEAFRTVPREAFVPPGLVEFAYRDVPLPIGEGQTISQPYIVALTIEALGLRGDERVLEIGTGSGYAAAVLSLLSREVYTVERIPELAEAARERFARLGYDNVHVLVGDGTLGWPEHAPYEGIAVAASGPEVPKALSSQLRIGGRLVIPVGDESSQTLLRLVRDGEDSFRRESLGDVHFVPLIGEQGWSEPARVAPSMRPPAEGALPALVREAAERIDSAEPTSVDALLERIGDSRLVLLGEATHGTSEFYRMRARISRALIEKRGFDFVAVEADWPDAATVDRYVMGDEPQRRPDFVPFARFPTWMWRNQEVAEFAAWLRTHNVTQRDGKQRAGFHGLDLYSLFTSISAVLTYLDEVDPSAAQVARARYGLLTPWQKDPAAYGRAVLAGRYEAAESAVVSILRNLLDRRMEYARQDGERLFDATQNARVVANAERYYRAMYYGSVASWNLRDSHMFDTLEALFSFYGPNSKGIVWEHNSHVGDALATEMSERDELNVGQLCRARFGDGAYIIGFGTDHGTVAAARDWDEPVERMTVRPALAGSYERLFHDSRVPAFLLHLRDPRRAAVRDELLESRLERAIGVVYRPDTERASHYFRASLPRQFDEFVWFDETTAVSPLRPAPPVRDSMPETYPFGV